MGVRKFPNSRTVHESASAVSSISQINDFENYFQLFLKNFLWEQCLQENKITKDHFSLQLIQMILKL